MEGRAVKPKTHTCVPVLRDTRESTVKQTPTTADQTPVSMEPVQTLLLATNVNATLATRAKTANKTLTTAILPLVTIWESAQTSLAGFLVIVQPGGMETFVSRMSMNASGRCLAITMPPAKT